MEAIALAELAKIYGPPGAFLGLLFFYAIRAFRDGDDRAKDFMSIREEISDIRERVARIEGYIGAGK